ncbi:hypothetical protein C0W42_11285 [Photobacterium kishitanii]|uniref:hypothetical protein n=1 Tax=Photobacterium kishitanii TaxID=318456 RepID=UPI000D165A9C|nr:hypothetical protein [Photobacterium kishitanii]PSU88913.1 hypothetical protein C0W42_11285 [Photobacterium kishitanii]
MNNFNIPPSQRKPNTSSTELDLQPAKYRMDITYSKSDTDLNLLTKKLILKFVPEFNEVVTVNNFEFLNDLSNISLNKQVKKELVSSLITLDYLNINKCIAFVDSDWTTASDLYSNGFISILLTYGGTSRVITTANEFLNKYPSYILNEGLTDSASVSASYTKLYFSDNSDSALKAATKRYEALIDKALLVVRDDISNAVACFREVKLAEIKAMEQAEANRIKLKEMLG